MNGWIIRLNAFRFFELGNCFRCFSVPEKYGREIESRLCVIGLELERDFIFALCIIDLAQLAQG